MSERLLHSVHLKGDDFWTVEDRFRPFALALPFLWAYVSGLWIAGTVLLALFVSLPFFLGIAGPVLWYAIMLICGWEGGSLMRLELRLRGWREAGLVEAATRQGAEELWLEGKAIRVGAA